jgi:hypothetical protein
MSQRPLALLESNVAREGDALVPKGHVDDGFALGQWVARRRLAYQQGRVDPERSTRLEELPGWSCTPRRTAGVRPTACSLPSSGARVTPLSARTVSRRVSTSGCGCRNRGEPTNRGGSVRGALVCWPASRAGPGMPPRLAGSSITSSSSASSGGPATLGSRILLAALFDHDLTEGAVANAVTVAGLEGILLPAPLSLFDSRDGKRLRVGLSTPCRY